MTEPTTQQDQPDISTLSYEQAREELVVTVKRLETGNLPLKNHCGCGNAAKLWPTSASHGSMGTGAPRQGSRGDLGRHRVSRGSRSSAGPAEVT